MISLIGKEGQFRTDDMDQRPGFRTFGLWSVLDVHPLDVVVIKRSAYLVAYSIEEVRCEYTGSDGNRWWTGVMKDIIYHDCLTSDIKGAILASLASS